MINYLLGKGALFLLLALALLVAAALAGHYGIIGPRRFSHEGRRFVVFSAALRAVHWIAAASCTVLVLTGIVMLCAGTPGLRERLHGAPWVRVAWHVHAWTSIAFAASALFLLARWAGRMLPRRVDLRWLAMGGGYLHRVQPVVPAHLFNAGQKSWFWLATGGGLVSAATGLVIHLFVGGSALLNAMAFVHHALAVAIVAMYLVHVYMAAFAIQGSLQSMIDGTKGEAELSTLHGLYYQELEADAWPAQGAGGDDDRGMQQAGDEDEDAWAAQDDVEESASFSSRRSAQ